MNNSRGSAKIRKRVLSPYNYINISLWIYILSILIPPCNDIKIQRHPGSPRNDTMPAAHSEESHTPKRKQAGKC